MCKAKSDGGQRCTCPPPVRRAQRRAKYAADKMAAKVAVEGGAIKRSGQLTGEELVNRASHQLRTQADLWADRDPAYAKQLRDAADAQEMLEALRGGPDLFFTKMPKELWATNDGSVFATKRVGFTNFDDSKYERSVVDAGGNQVEWDSTGWEQYEHTARSVSKDGERWTMAGEGTLHNPDTGRWLVYRWHDDGAGTTLTEGTVADSLDAAAGHLTNDERGNLGLPANRPAPLVVEEVSKTSQAEIMKDLRRQLVGDTADADAAVEFAAKMQAMRLEAVARGAATDHKWSMTNRLTTSMEAALRGTHIAGWMGGTRQWEAQDRVLKPGAEPYTIWAPVIKTAKAVEDETATTTPGGGVDTNTPAVRRVSKTTADGKRLVGFQQVKVYDWTQTVRRDGQPDPDWKASVPGGNEELLARLTASSPFPVEYDHSGNTTGHAHGWTDGRKIVLDPNKSVGNQISTLAHEMTHAELDHVGRISRGELTRAEAEQEAQLAAYLVVRSLDLGEDNDKAMTETTSSYLRNWSREGGKPVAGHKQRWKLLQDRITPASDASHKILTRLLALDGPKAQKNLQGVA